MCKPGCINALKSSMLLPIRKCLVNVMMLLCILILCRVFVGHDRLKFGCMDSACGPGTKIYMIPFSKYMRLNRTLEQFKSLRPSPFNSWPRRWKSCFSANRAGLKHWSNGMATPNSVLWRYLAKMPSATAYLSVSYNGISFLISFAFWQLATGFLWRCFELWYFKPSDGRSVPPHFVRSVNYRTVNK